ncbi:MAG: hydroxymethylglutaryl-CoA lyase [Acidobacteria bacterium]|nr:MAG: hydroxymethylglutaryl-CoA lyase [Acidobacteriota bacterium]
MAFPKRVIFCECWARDGLQSVPVWVPTDRKLEMIERFVDAGFPKIEVTSFSHPKLLPQFRDAEEVLRRLPRTGRAADVSYVVLMPNERGFDRFERCVEEGYGAHEIILMISASEEHNLRNFRMRHEEAFRAHERIMRRAHRLGVHVIGCAGTVYGCPIMGDVSFEAVAKIVRFYLDNGARTIMLGDTTGMANPVLVKERIGRLMDTFPGAQFIAHFHDTRGTGIANTVAALETGVVYVDGSVGAIGGQPATGAPKYHVGYTGNISSEDTVALLHEMGIETGIDLDKLIEAGRRAEEILGMKLRSEVVRCGPVNHGPAPAEKGEGERLVLPE